MKFKNPTVKEVIAALAALPPDMPFVLMDADTGCRFDSFNIDPGGKAWENEGTIALWATYADDIGRKH
jgi:prophage tail gpP-like protein